MYLDLSLVERKVAEFYHSGYKALFGSFHYLERLDDAIHTFFESFLSWFFMGIARINFTPPPTMKWANVEKKCPKLSWQALTPPDIKGLPKG